MQVTALVFAACLGIFKWGVCEDKHVETSEAGKHIKFCIFKALALFSDCWPPEATLLASSKHGRGLLKVGTGRGCALPSR